MNNYEHNVDLVNHKVSPHRLDAAAKAGAAAIYQKAVIVTLTVQQWRAVSVRRDVTAQLTASHQVPKTAAKVQANLIEPQYLRGLWSAITAARSAHKRYSLVWGGDGQRLLPLDRSHQYETAMHAAMDQFEREKTIFLAEYNNIKASAATALGVFFDPNAYPTAAELRHKFSVSYHFLPIPQAAHFSANVTRAQCEKIRASIDEIVQRRLHEAHQSLRQEIGASIRHLIKQLGVDAAGEPRALHKAAFSNLLELADEIPALNVTSDPAIPAVSAALKTALADQDLKYFRRRSRDTKETERTQRQREALSRKLEAIIDGFCGNSKIGEH
ncbi:MAG: hypothetical protein OXC63_08150 [Aestuariivita sp.]|nr:hypothetical protein [Aestuariivita sp.]MCY4345362.1 hypothetical protein [Aestuariivita sp.]